MKWLLGGYTSGFNRRHQVFGHLFSGRYKSLIVDGSGEGYLKTVRIGRGAGRAVGGGGVGAEGVDRGGPGRPSEGRCVQGVVGPGTERENDGDGGVDRDAFAHGHARPSDAPAVWAGAQEGQVSLDMTILLTDPFASLTTSSAASTRSSPQARRRSGSPRPCWPGCRIRGRRSCDSTSACPATANRENNSTPKGEGVTGRPSGSAPRARCGTSRTRRRYGSARSAAAT